MSLVQTCERNRSRTEARCLMAFDTTATRIAFPFAEQAARLTRCIDSDRKPAQGIETEYLVTSRPATQMSAQQMLQADLVSHLRQQVDGHQIHEIEQQDPAEDRQRERRDELAVAVEGIAHLGVDEIDQHFYEELRLAGHARRGLARHPPEEADEHDRQQNREEDAVDVGFPEAFAVLKVGQMVNDVLATCLCVPACGFDFC